MKISDIQILDGTGINDTKAKLAYTTDDGDTTVVAVCAGWSVFRAQEDGSRKCVHHDESYAAPLTNLQRGIEVATAPLAPAEITPV